MKAILTPAHVMTAQSMAASFNGTAMSVQQGDKVTLQVNYTTGSSPVGTLKLQASLDHAQDYLGNVSNAGTWADLVVTVGGVTSSSIAIPGSTGPILIDIDPGSIPYIRLAYTRTSGSGSMDVYLAKKRLGD